MACSNITLLIEGHYFEDNWGGGGQLVDVANNLNSCTFNINTPFGTTENNVQINKNSNKSFTNGIKVYTIYVTDILQEGGIYGVRFYVCYEDSVTTGTIGIDKPNYYQGETMVVTWSNVNFDGIIKIINPSNNIIEIWTNITGSGNRSYTFAQNAQPGIWRVRLYKGDLLVDNRAPMVISQEGFCEVVSGSFYNSNNELITSAKEGDIVYFRYTLKNTGAHSDNCGAEVFINNESIQLIEEIIDVNQEIPHTTPPWIMGSSDMGLSLYTFHYEINEWVVDNHYVDTLLFEEPTTGTLVCHSTPEGAQIWINGSNTGEVTPKIFTDMTPGSYTVVFKKPGYDNCTKSIVITAGDITGASCTLIPALGSIVCGSIPSGALIFLDGNSILQYTPHTITGVTPGSHTLRYTKTGYNFCEVTVTVTAGGTIDANCTLTEIPTTGNILCITFDENGNEISGALIFKNQVNTQQYTPHTFTDQSPGAYHINFEKTGYVGCFDDVNVVAGFVSTAHCILVVVPTTGSLSITSEPIEAKIWLDGNYTGLLTGNSPVIISNLGPGTHTVICKKPGYNDSPPVQQDVIIGETRSVHCILEFLPCYDFLISKIQEHWNKNTVDLPICEQIFDLNNSGVINNNDAATASLMTEAERCVIVDQYNACIAKVNTLIGLSKTPDKDLYHSGETVLITATLTSASNPQPPNGTPIKFYEVNQIGGELLITTAYTFGNQAPIEYIINESSPTPVEQEIIAKFEGNETYKPSQNFIILNVIKEQLLGIIKCSTIPEGAQIWMDDIVGGDLIYKGIAGTIENPTIISGVHLGITAIEFRLTDYDTCQQTVFVEANGVYDAFCTLVPSVVVPKPGFDITVNIPGLLPNSKLYVEEVERIPLTDTWINLPLASGMRWENISNRVYKAKVLAADCDPLTTSHSGFRLNQDYVIYVGTSSISLYPGSLVHRSIDGVVDVNLTESYVDWVSNKICSAFEISPEQCSNFVFTSVNDAAFLLEEWMIITEHKNLAGEETLPTWLDYALMPIAILGIFSPGISEGALSKIIGKRLTELIKISKIGPVDVHDVLQDHTLDTFIMRATESQFDDFIRYMEQGLGPNAKAVLKVVEDAPLSVNEVHALQRGSKLVEKIDEDLIRAGSLETTSGVLSNFSPKLMKVYHNVITWVLENPIVPIIGASGVGVAAIWYIGKNNSEYIDNTFKAKGVSQSNESWNAKEYIRVLESYYYILEDAEKLSNWTLFCENMILWQTNIDHFEAYLLANKSTLENDGTYEVLNDSLILYKKSIEIKNEVHTCIPTILPEVFTAKVTNVVDGDTIDIEYLGEEHRVRFLGINTPEGSGENYLIRRLTCPTCDEERWNANKALYDKIKAWANLNMWHKDLIFKSDLSRQFDDYDRLLAVPYDGTVNLCKKELELGYAVVFFYDDNNKVNTTEFLAAEKVAKDAKIGVWAIPIEYGSIRCVSYPTAAEVWLDGINTGHKTVNNVYILEKVPLGLHTVTFKKIINDVPNSCSKTVTVKLNEEVTAECTLTPGEVPPPPPPPTEEAIWNIGAVKNEAGETLGAAKVWVDGIYTGHYAPETLTFCSGCKCDTIIPCGFGEHTVTITRTNYADWTKTRMLAAGNVFTDNPVMLPPTFPIEILSDPAGATIKVDGVTATTSIGRVNLRGKNLIEQILSGAIVTPKSSHTTFTQKLRQLK